MLGCDEAVPNDHVGHEALVPYARQLEVESVVVCAAYFSLAMTTMFVSILGFHSGSLALRPGSLMC